MAKIVWTDLSVLDLKEIFDYISKDSKRYAENQVRRIRAKTNILKYKPEAGRIVPELQIKQISELIEENYRIIFRILDTNLIEILTVHHSARSFNLGENI